MKIATSLFLVMLIAILNGTAQTTFPNTLQLNDTASSPKADLSAIDWLAGHWQGNAFGGLTEEIWTSPMAGSMMGAFKLVVDGQVQFYELETISEESESLIFRLKHFDPQLKGWEAKGEVIEFRLVKVSRNKVYFEGLTIERIQPDEIVMYVVIGEPGKEEEVEFRYFRVKHESVH